MRVWLISDIHVESLRGWDLPSGEQRPDFDVLVCAGDLITRFERGVVWLQQRIPDRPIIYVAGNHEAWGTDIDVTLDKARNAAAGSNVHVLERESISIDGVTFLGATGWTDFALFGNQLLAMNVAAEGMNDYRKIRTRSYAEKLRPIDTLRRHEATRAFLAYELARPKSGPRFVVTHHCPFPDIQESQPGLIEAAYCSDMTDLMVRSNDPLSGHAIVPPDVWAFGHTHRSCDRIIGLTRVVSNAKGYGPFMPRHRAWENPSFNPTFTFELAPPRPLA